jgi:hypothetical protein
LNDLLAFGILGGLIISTFFGVTVRLWLKLIVFILHALKWLFIIGFLSAFLNAPQFYESFGWTPISILVDIVPGPHTGAELYKQTPQPTPTKKRTVNARNKNSEI